MAMALAIYRGLLSGLINSSQWDAQTMQGLVDAMEAALPDFAWPNYVLGNHDRIRLATRFGGQAQAQAQIHLPFVVTA